MNDIKSHKIAEFQLFSRKHMFRKRHIGGWGEGSLGSVNSFLFKVFCVFYLWLYFFYNQLEMIVNILSNIRYRPSTQLITERPGLFDLCTFRDIQNIGVLWLVIGKFTWLQFFFLKRFIVSFISFLCCSVGSFCSFL